MVRYNSNSKASQTESSALSEAEGVRQERFPNNSSNRRTHLSTPEKAVGLLDSTNKKIISLLEFDPETSQMEIAKKLKLSQSSIALRLEKLRRSGLLTETLGVNAKYLGLQMCRVDISCSDTDQVQEWAKTCPLFVNGSVSVGGTNVSLFFVAEDYEMFQQIVDEHLRRLPGITNLQFVPIVSWTSISALAIPLSIEKRDYPPCNMLPYCAKCPSNPEYNGKIWDDGQRNK